MCSNVDMRSPTDIISAWPSMAAFSADIGVKPKHAYQMKFRNSVPVAYWPRLVAAAGARGISIRYEDLVSAHAAGHAREQARAG